MWYYNDKPFTSDMIGDYLGFVYEITDTRNGMIYIGKKGLMSKRRLPPLKGAKRKRIKIVETDWAKYYGSNETVKQLVEELGPEIFHRKIIRPKKGACFGLYVRNFAQEDRIKRGINLLNDVASRIRNK